MGLYFLTASVYAQSFSEAESPTQDGQCQDVTIKASVNQMWSLNGMTVSFTVSGWNAGARRARLINDWSRLKMKLKYRNAVSGKYVIIDPPLQMQNNQFINDAQKQGNGNNGNWRFYFKDGQSRTLSDTVERQ